MADIQYKLLVTVDDEIVYMSTFPDSVMLEESLGKGEQAVEDKLKEMEQ